MEEKKERFKKLKEKLKGKKAMAESNASKNPMKYYKENAEPSIKGLKGIAF